MRGLLDREAQVIAVGVNCTAPGLITASSANSKQATAKPIFVYPNSGERWDADRRAWVGEGEIQDFGKLARLWRPGRRGMDRGLLPDRAGQIRAVTAVWHTAA